MGFSKGFWAAIAGIGFAWGMMVPVVAVWGL